MCLQKGKAIKVNHALTNQIIKLHESGYTEDFVTRRTNGQLFLISEDQEVVSDFHISLINQFYDRLHFKFIYLHAIETNCGQRGIALSSDLLFTCCPDRAALQSPRQTHTEIKTETDTALRAL